MNNFIKFPSIGQFRNMVKHVVDHSRFVGLDEQGKAIFDHAIIPPTLNFRGRVKLHGTNAGVTLDVKTGLIFPQSREREIAVGKDNAGFAQFVETTGKDSFYGILHTLALKHVNAEKVTIFGEWAGGSIQKNVGINGVEKFFAGFEYSVKYEDDIVIKHYFLPSEFKAESCRIFHVDDFCQYEMDIDFQNPENSINKLTELTDKVEEDCPAARYMGSQGIGEGIVWSHSIEDGEILRFKVKGKKHSSSKVKTLATIDPEKLESIDKFVEYAVTDNRLMQGFDEVFTQNELEPVIQKVGLFIRWVNQDVVKEETDTLTENKLEMRDVGKKISNKARTWFIKNYC